MKEKIVREAIVEDILEELEGCGIDSILIWLISISEIAKSDKYYDVNFDYYENEYGSERLALMGTRKVMVKTEEEIAEDKDLAEYKRLKEKYG